MEDREYNLEVKRYHQEWWKSAISVALTIAVIFLGWSVQQSLNVQKAELDRQQEIITSKKDVYAKLGEALNRIYIYAADVGDFASFTPPQVVAFKREADTTFYMYKAYWSESTRKAFLEFEDAAFKPYRGPGLPAGIRGLPDQKIAAYRIQHKPWDTAWNGYFTNERDGQLTSKYDLLVIALLSDVADSHLYVQKNAK